MKDWHTELTRSDLLNEKPGEVACDVSVRLFLDSKRFAGVAEWTSLDVMMDLDRIFRDSKSIVKRSVIRSHYFPFLKTREDRT